jgi:3-oxoacid CoA-transferase subunit A
MQSKIYESASAAIRGLLSDGMTIMAGGFGLCGIPEALIEAIRDSGAKDLTFISNNAGGAGIPAFYTKTGVGTLIAEGKEVREFNGETYVMETSLFADISVVHAWKGDTEGNLVYRKTARNFNPMMATASRLTIAEVEHLVPAGELDPDGIHTPGIFVKRMVHVPNPVKHIEQRTTRKRAEAAPAGAGEEV